jgi:PAS domain S-box-containing protein
VIGHPLRADAFPADEDPSGLEGRYADVERRLRAAVAADAVDLAFQPVVDLATASVVGFESLSRWTDRDLGPVTPDEFIPVAERSGLVVDLGRSVLVRSCRQAAAWQTERPGLLMSVNVSPVELRQPSFVDSVREALDESGLDPTRLVLEVTETTVVTDVAAAAATLGRLKGFGVRFALDDFGTGHSSLTLLRSLPLDLVKIDRSLICGVAVNASDAVLVQLVVDAAHTLGLRVCAEGVEGVDQAQQLLAMGCDTGQGWLFGRPRPKRQAAAQLTRPQSVPTWLVEGTPPVALTGSDDLVVMTGPDRVVTYASASGRRILGRSPSELVGEPLDSVFGQAVAYGEATLEVERQDGGRRWLRGVVQPLRDDDGAIRETLCVLSDVTAVVARERALADSEELFRSAFSGAPIGIALSDFDGQMLRVNTAMERLLGRTNAELLTMTVADITHPDDLAIDQTNLDEVRRGQALGHQVLKRYLHADGSAVPVEVHAASVRTADGEPYCIVAHILPRAVGHPSSTGPA